MESATSGRPLGEVLDTCLDMARADWLVKHKAGRDEESAWTLEVVETSLMVQLKHGGRARAQVCVLSRRPFNSETVVFTLRQRGPRAWLIVNHNVN